MELSVFLDRLPELVVAGILYSIPIIIAAWGGLFSERVGVVNIGLEGIMNVGAFAAATYIALIGDMGFGLTFISALLVGGLFGMLLSILHIWATVYWRSDHVVSGIALNLIALAVCIYLSMVIFGRTETTLLTNLTTRQLYIFPDLAREHQMAQIFTWPLLVMLMLGVVTYFVVYKTKLGLRLRACGENPEAADSAGIDVKRTRTIGVLLSGAYAGIAGAMIVFLFTRQFSGVSISGLGFIGLATLIFGKWKPVNVLVVGLFFGFFTAIGNIGPVMFPEVGFPTEIFSMIPFILTIFALVLFVRGDAAPKAVGKNFIKEN